MERSVRRGTDPWAIPEFRDQPEPRSHRKEEQSALASNDEAVKQLHSFGAGIEAGRGNRNQP